MKALHIGAGKIGRGFIGAQIAQSGFELTFADVNTELVSALNAQKSYTLHIMERDGESQTITSFNAVEIGSEEFFERFSDADTERWCRDMVGFADCAVDRILPIATFDNALDVGVERYCEWCIDRGQIVGELPAIVGVNFTDNLEASIERKLYTVNSAHCATAYLGAIKGYKFIHQAVTDTTIRQIIEQVMAESSAALCAKFGFDADSQQLYAQSVLRRFENPYLGDTVARVARDPKRKLSPILYFAYPIAMALNYNLATEVLAIATAAALHYRSDDDTESQQLSAMVALYGVAKSAEMVTGIADKAFLRCVEQKYSDF